MKRIVSCLLVVLLISSFTACAFAVDSPKPGGDAKVKIIPVDSPELTDEQREGAAAATETLEGLEDLKADVEGLAAAAGEQDVSVGGMYYVKALWFPTLYAFPKAEANSVIGVLYFGMDGLTSPPTFVKAIKANHTTIFFPAEGWYCTVYGAGVESPA